MRFVWLVLLGLFCAGCPPKLVDYPYDKEPDPRQREVELGVGDVVSINVWGPENRDFNTEATIRADGTITMPLLGDLKAAGATPSALKKEITTKVQAFVKFQPGQDLVTVTLKNWRSYRFTIQGEVTRQGVFSSDHFVTIADAIAQAGGPTRFAKRREVILFRLDPETRQTKKIPFDYDLLSSGKRLDMNIYVLAGDVIYIP
ncbi:MAG: polysaccharide export protein [Deltaproteobacteria bacterium]|nr:polysaccharide export protein [Deltaproteobacteria bacterium]MCW5801956.1 polysaccharide export protein [Deltaproteobacteria bacterium]